MFVRYKGGQLRKLVPKLPRNLVLFDGKCLMSQARARYVIERNFNYFGYLSFVRSTDLTETEMFERIDRHKMHFASLHSTDAASVVRLLKVSRPAGGTIPEGSSYENATVVFLEKVPSSGTFFLRRKGGSSSGSRASGAQDNLLLRLSEEQRAGKKVSEKETGDAAVRTALLSNPNEVDVIVSTDFAAICRIGMHVDRWLPSLFFGCMFYCTPTSVGKWWFDKYVNERRKKIWGTSEQDAMVALNTIEGMRERRWSMRN
ncbi:hypothetical protein ADEAN_000864900 [Angomonas deanei]|uniref:Uncharacterized protein n=1 Tax=Angomonas deanei TaxID=59799 RepID=A0A7G2CMQ7_9TRYP|nr:hypothetical protein ADEAN_000864900 [Angomonas deanei]